jgi:hypothetical protein
MRHVETISGMGRGVDKRIMEGMKPTIINYKNF